MTTTTQIQGHCDPRFTAVRQALVENFEKRGDVGAAVCVYVNGKPVVDLWGGYANAARTRPWDHNTVASVASTTKGMVAICAHMLVERGVLDLEAPVARYWPEFAQAEKATISVRWLLSHRAGLPAIRRDMSPQSLYDWHAFTEALAETTPWWEPGTRHGYHALTFGHLVGEVIRRISGKSVGQFLRAEVTGPLAADFFIGVPETEDARAAEILPDPPPRPGDPTMWEALLRNPTSMAGRAFLNPPRTPEVVNTRAWRAAEIPAGNGHTTARALARIYGALACGGTLDGVHLLQPATIEAAIVEQSAGLDAILSFPTRFGLGFMLTLPERPFGPNPRAFGHPGRGGSIGFADLDGGIGFGYVVNQYQTGTLRNPDLRWPTLVEAVYASLGSK
ncbi:MAG TPA: serine hydrolase domain-containing protein [Candidatus Binatia bacterium]|nr:serine hydrolase domain-containing protein [Candidatus Binatia bacterium]